MAKSRFLRVVCGPSSEGGGTSEVRGGRPVPAGVSSIEATPYHAQASNSRVRHPAPVYLSAPWAPGGRPGACGRSISRTSPPSMISHPFPHPGQGESLPKECPERQAPGVQGISGTNRSVSIAKPGRGGKEAGPVARRSDDERGLERHRSRGNGGGEGRREEPDQLSDRGAVSSELKAHLDLLKKWSGVRRTETLRTRGLLCGEAHGGS